MSDAPPPAYSSVNAGENISPPAYDEQAASAPPSYNPSAPVSKPVAQTQYVDQNGNQVKPPPTANVKYVDQYGNPVNPPPAANVKYVDQYGNPVKPPAQQPAPQQPAVKYVDQYGNPVKAPVQQQPAVKYVDQYGNPVKAPAQKPVVQPTANVKYVDQYGNPVNPPPTANVKYVDQYGNPVNAPTTTSTTPGVVVGGAPGATKPVMQSVKQQRIASTVLGAVALLILFVGLCVDALARGTTYTTGYYDVTYTCGWTELRVDCGDTYSYLYSSSCTDSSLSYADACELETQYGTDTYGAPSWCGTQASASISLVTMLIATIMCGIGVLLVQPWCAVTPCCCKTNPNCGCARVLFLFSLSFCLLTLIIWLAGDDVCLGSGTGTIDMGLGGSIVCDIIGMIFVIIACSLAKS